MMHLLAYTIASAGGVTNQDTPGVQDSYATLQNNHYVLPVPWFIRWAFACGANLTNARINTPFLRQINLPSIGVIDAAANPTSLPGIDFFDSPMIKLAAIDETAMELTDSAGAGQLFGLLGLQSDNNVNIPQGLRSRIRATASITVGNKVWGAGTMTLDQPLPAGNYGVIGMDVVGANLVAARLIFQGGGPRPGVLARTTVANKPNARFLSGLMGLFGTFSTIALPSIELIGTAAPTTQTIFLDLVQM